MHCKALDALAVSRDANSRGREVGSQDHSVVDQAVSGKRERKEPRRRVLKDGKIVSPTLHGALDVRIRDLSTSGALIEIAIGTVLPGSYGLLVVSESKVYPAVTRWRGERVGLEFTGPPKSATLRKW